MNRRDFLLGLVGAVVAGELLARLAPDFPSSDSIGDVLKRGSLRIPQGYVWEWPVTAT